MKPHALLSLVLTITIHAALVGHPPTAPAILAHLLAALLEQLWNDDDDPRE
ncbi:MAG TPA: hypothetical protein VHS09_15615 [Polyangiaceae bacterium]|jgi:hypothetical protein|nr:hypothetical protein [Polyangiaceae bacterium]